MSRLVVDASVWVSAIDPADRFHETGDAFLDALIRRRVQIVLPSIARLEVSCALARIYRDPMRARHLSEAYLSPPFRKDFAMTEAFIEAAIATGTERKLRAGDALYAALAVSAGLPLVAWDQEIIERADAITPRQWLDDGS